MLAPDSVGLLVILGAVAVGAMVVALRGGPLVLRLVAGLLALAVVFVAGAATVNVYFGYFTTWGDITSGLGGTPAAPAVRPGPAGLSAAAVRSTLATLPVSASGTLLAVPLPGSRSRIDGRSGYVWLPPQYREAAYAHTRFPVVELIPGTPGQPSDWVRNIHVTTMLAALTASRHIGPMVVIMAPSNPPVGSGNGEECTNKPIKGPQDATYMGRDVPADVAAAFRVYPPGPRWAVGGFSSGGYCAAKLAVGYPKTFGAVADLDGYLSPLEDGDPLARHLLPELPGDPGQRRHRHDRPAPGPGAPALLSGRGDGQPGGHRRPRDIADAVARAAPADRGHLGGRCQRPHLPRLGGRSCPRPWSGSGTGSGSRRRRRSAPPLPDRNTGGTARSASSSTPRAEGGRRAGGL